jgi:hypothetical protein
MLPVEPNLWVISVNKFTTMDGNGNDGKYKGIKVYVLTGKLHGEHRAWLLEHLRKSEDSRIADTVA